MKFTSLITFAAVLSVTLGLSSALLFPKASIEPYLNNEFIQKRDYTGNTPDETAKYVLNSNVNLMKKLVHDEYVNFTKFAEKKAEYKEEVEYTLTWIQENKFEKDYKEEIAYIQHFFKSLEVAEDARNRFMGCNYWGSDLVMQMAMLGIKALNFNTVSESSSDGKKLLEILMEQVEFSMEQLEERASKDTKMSSRMRNLFEERAKDTRKSLGFLKKANDAFKKGFMENNKTCEEF